MKRFKIIIGLAVAISLGLFVAAKSVQGADYEMTITSNTPTAGRVPFATGGYPNIDGNLYLEKLIITNYALNAAASPQLVTLYTECTSSTAATAEMYYVIPASTTYIISFDDRMYRLEDICLSKRGTTNTTRAQIIYR